MRRMPMRRPADAPPHDRSARANGADAGGEVTGEGDAAAKKPAEKSA